MEKQEKWETFPPSLPVFFMCVPGNHSEKREKSRRRNPFSHPVMPGFLRDSKCVSGKSWRISVLDCSGRENARPEKEERPKQKRTCFVVVQQKGKRRRRTFRPTRCSPLLFNSPSSCVFGTSGAKTVSAVCIEWWRSSEWRRRLVAYFAFPPAFPPIHPTVLSCRL